LPKREEVKNAGDAAMILLNEETDGFRTIADTRVLSATHVSFAAGLKIKAYINLTETHMKTILFKGTVCHCSPIISICSILLITRSQSGKPGNSDTRHHWARRENFSCMAIPS
jgi:hypothetical protein